MNNRDRNAQEKIVIVGNFRETQKTSGLISVDTYQPALSGKMKQVSQISKK